MTIVALMLLTVCGMILHEDWTEEKEERGIK